MVGVEVERQGNAIASMLRSILQRPEKRASLSQ
jgi:hypothetical protein